MSYIYGNKQSFPNMTNIEDSRTQRLLDNLAMKTSQPKAMDQNKEIRRKDVGSTEFMVTEKNIGIINFDNVKTQLRKAKTQDVVEHNYNFKAGNHLSKIRI